MYAIRSYYGSIGNPYYELGKRLWQGEEHREALFAWQKAFKLTPGDPRNNFV